MFKTTSDATSSARLFRVVVFSVISLVVLLVVAGVSLTHRGRAEMMSSDQAFHSGDLRGSIRHAKAAALSYLPGSNHVLAAYERLAAIAKGAEAKGDHELGRLGWETLRNVHEQTKYPGRPTSDWEREATAGIQRIDAAFAGNTLNQSNKNK